MNWSFGVFLIKKNVEKKRNFSLHILFLEKKRIKKV